jgi:ABC-type branched-subunit amino acid transport system substrate-binding protein
LSYAADKKEPKLFPSAADWEKAWREKFKAVPEFLEVGYYASTILALLAVEATKSTDREVLRKWLEEQQYQTPVGDSKFEKSRIALHQAFGEMIVFQRQKKAGGAFESVLIYPAQIATGKLQACTQ